MLQARYLVERQDLDVYGKVLDPENEHRKAVVEQLVNTALPESKHPEMVSTCVKAFMAAGLQAELIKLLEMIVLQDSAFSSNQNLQNLLIITALKSDPSRVADYVHRLDGFEPKAVAQVRYPAISELFYTVKVTIPLLLAQCCTQRDLPAFLVQRQSHTATSETSLHNHLDTTVWTSSQPQ